MKKSNEKSNAVLDKLEEIYDEEDFQTVILSTLKNDYECEHLLRLIDKFDIQTPDNVLIATVIIDEVAAKKERKGDYLKNIGDCIERALLDENGSGYGEKDYYKEDKDFKEENDLSDIDFYKTVEDAENGDTGAKWNLVNSIAVGYADAYADEFDLDALYFENLCGLAENGNAASYIMLGDAILKGKGCRQNTEEAVRWYEKAVENGVKFGNECIGEIYFTGEYASPDYKKAYEYFTKDEGKKSFCTLFHLGEMYRLGLYVEKDLEKACEYYREIVYDGNPSRRADDYYGRACSRLESIYNVKS